jgi:hypothetical protein
VLCCLARTDGHFWVYGDGVSFEGPLGVCWCESGKERYHLGYKTKPGLADPDYQHWRFLLHITQQASEHIHFKRAGRSGGEYLFGTLFGRTHSLWLVVGWYWSGGWAKGGVDTVRYLDAETKKGGFLFLRS